jgi:hypothetical protein
MPYYFGFTARAGRPIATSITIKGGFCERSFGEEGAVLIFSDAIRVSFVSCKADLSVTRLKKGRIRLSWC